MLRNVTDDDLSVFFEHQLDPEANRMAAFPARDHEAFMTHWRTKVLVEPSTVVRTIVVDGEVAGNVGSFERSGKRLIGYWIGRMLWGRGVATGAVGEFLKDHDRRRPIHAYVASHNVASIRVLQKCGFQCVSGPSAAPDGVEELLFRIDE
jgi:RimJ/RimL family protein N-acetyltransferase